VATQELPPKLAHFLERAEEVFNRSGGRYLVIRGGGYQHTITCPAHDDQKPSLSVTWDNGKVLFDCKGGCEPTEILEALDLTWQDLEQPKTVTATYPYEDENGTLLYEVVRYEPKTFSQRRPDPDAPGKWINNMTGVTPVPFNLPQLAEALEAGEDVYIVEGEKDVQVLWNAEHVIATCNHGGGGQWKAAHSAYFVGSKSRVHIVADRDKTGYTAALKTYDSLLEKAGITAELLLPKSGKDTADHIADNATVAQFMPTTVAELTELKNADDAAAEQDFDAKVQQELERIAVREAARRVHAAQEASGLFAGFTDASLREAFVAPRERVPWVIESLQRAGHKAFLVAQFKAGKTTVSGNVVKALADHEPLFGRFATHDLAGNIGILDYELTEDDALDMYREMGLRNEQRIFLQSLRGTGFTLANESHAEMLVAWCRAHDIEYLTVDPFGRAMKGFGEENSNDDVRAFLMSLDTVAKEAGLLGILMPVHTGRAAVEIGSERARGATVLDDDADARWILTKDAQGRRFFRADGRRGVGVEEISLDFDAGCSRLTVSDMSREESAGERFTGAVLNFLDQDPGAVLNAVKKGVDGSDKQIAAAVKLLIKQGLVRVDIVGNAHHHYLTDRRPQKFTLRTAEQDEI
jgi:hypothetical protein